MYEEHSTFIQPEDTKAKIWRYVDFTKFVSLIDSQRLYFTRADKFADPFEGSWPKINVIARGNVPESVSQEGREAYLKGGERIGEVAKNIIRHTAINCWHMNDHESAAMWKLYLKSDEGIAIQSTYSKLQKSLVDDETVHLGEVKYIDYDKEFINTINLFEPFMHKRKSFEYEKEIRAVVGKWPRDVFDPSVETIPHGLKIEVDLKTLVERIFIAPSAPTWFVDLVKAVIVKYGYEFQVTRSKLDEEAVY